jgi:hypothetical protein
MKINFSTSSGFCCTEVFLSEKGGNAPVPRQSLLLNEGRLELTKK